MSVDLQMNAEAFGAAGLGNAVACAVAVALADMQMDESEQQAIAGNLCGALGVDAETASTLVMQGLEKAASVDRESLFAETHDVLDGSGRDACFVLACAVATRSGGIGMKEGLELQKMAKALEIGYPSDRYTQLLSRGMQMGRAR